MKRVLIIFIFLIFICCKVEENKEKDSIKSVISSEKKAVRQEEETETLSKEIKYLELDSLWVNRVFKNTALTSDNGDMYSGLESKVYGLSTYSLKDKKLNVYLKKVNVLEGSLTEIFTALLSENEEELYDLKWVGNIGQILECKMNTKINPYQNGLKIKYSFLCFDGYNLELDKEFMADRITFSEINIKKNKLIVKSDTLTKRIELTY